MGPKKYQQYTQESMMKAIDAVNQGMSYFSASKQFGVPRVTLMGKHKGHVPLEMKMGVSTAFSTDQENLLAEWVIMMAKTGFPISKETLLYSARKLADELKLQVKESFPSKKWYKGFMQRNQNLSPRVCQNLTTSRRNVTKDNIKNWFKEVHCYFEEKGLISVFDDPSRIFNGDETSFFLNPKGGKVLAERGSKTVYQGAGNDEKENITTLIMGNAAGELAPPMIVFRYTRIPAAIATAVPKEWAIGRSESGWMNHENFFEYIANIFYPWLVKNNFQFPIVLFLDGHTSHMSLPLSQFCADKGIEMVALYPNATHILQPMDVAVFHTLKMSWKQKVQEWRMENGPLNKQNFAHVLSSVLCVISPEILKNGFRKCGLFPWNAEAVVVPELHVTVPQAVTTAVTDNQLRKYVAWLEDQIGVEKLSSFMENKGEWAGCLEDLSLYNIWRKVNQQVRPTHDMPPKAISPTPSLSSAPQDAFQSAPQISTPEQISQPPEVASTSQSESSTPQKGIGLMSTNEPKPSVCPSHVPSPFKRALFWPSEPASTKVKRKREKIPAVVTSPQMIHYFQKKEEIKKKLEMEKQERKKARDDKKITLQKKREEKLAKKGKKKFVVSDSETSDESVVPLMDSDSELCEEDSDEMTESVSEKNVKEGDFVISKFVGGKRNTSIFHYLCVVQEVSKDLIKVMGLKSIDKTKTEFVANETDISFISHQQIIDVVEMPELSVTGERIKYVFKKSLNVREK